MKGSTIFSSEESVKSTQTEATLLKFLNASSNPTSISPSYKKKRVVSSLQARLNRARVVDISIKITSRIILTVFFLILLFLQNYWLFEFLKKSLELGNIQDLQVVIGVITSVTLGETYLVVKTIVEKTFESNDYNAE